MNRDKKKAMQKKVRGMSANELYDYLVQNNARYGDHLINEFRKALHDEYGFGEKRFNKVLERMGKNAN